MPKDPPRDEIATTPLPFALVTPDVPLLYSHNAAARKLGVSRDTLDDWRKNGLISPRRARPGDLKAMYYTIFDLIRFVESMYKDGEYRQPVSSPPPARGSSLGKSSHPLR